MTLAAAGRAGGRTTPFDFKFNSFGEELFHSADLLPTVKLRFAGLRRPGRPGVGPDLKALLDSDITDYCFGHGSGQAHLWGREYFLQHF